MVYDENDPMDHYPYRNKQVKPIEEQFKSDIKVIACWLVAIAIVLIVSFYFKYNPIN